MRLHVDGVIFALQPHGGISRVFANLLPALAKRGDVEIVLHVPQGLPPGVISFPGVRTAYLPKPLQLRPGRLFRRVNAMLNRRAPDSYWGGLREGGFHSTYYTTHPALRIPQVVTIHDMIHEEFPRLFTGERAARHIIDKSMSAAAAAALVFPSTFSLKAASKYYDFDQRLTAVIPYALDDVFRSTPDPAFLNAFKLGYTGGEDFVLHTGSRYLHKNFPFLLKAFAEWSGHEQFRLVAIGGRETSPDEAGLISRLGLQNRVTVIPALNNSELVVAYHAARAFVSPSLSEGYGFPLLEAMACGVPSVAIKAGSLPEVGGDIPLWVQPGDLSAMVTALDEAVRTDPNGERILRGVTLARRRTWDDVADDYVRVYLAV